MAKVEADHVETSEHARKQRFRHHWKRHPLREMDAASIKVHNHHIKLQGRSRECTRVKECRCHLPVLRAPVEGMSERLR
jgi:hypothetical protein